MTDNASPTKEARMNISLIITAAVTISSGAAAFVLARRQSQLLRGIDLHLNSLDRIYTVLSVWDGT